MHFDQLIEHSADNLGEGTDAIKIEKLEQNWNIQLPTQLRAFLEKIGYAEIFGDEIYSIYEVPDSIPCAGLHWMNQDNQYLKNGFILFFANDLDGAFYIHATTGKVYLNSTDFVYSDSFIGFIDKILNA